jgi:hypothetical protein
LLIKSLTRAEKRYFKLHAAGNNHKNYLRLFDFIDKQKEYDEEAVKRRFKDEAFAKQLHVTKNYLNKLILKSLRNFHASLSIDAELKDSLRDIEILFKRELFDQCRYTIAKAEEVARAYEKHAALLEIYDWKRKLALQRLGGGKSRDEVNEVIAQERDSLKKLQTVNEYWDLTVNQFKSRGDSNNQKKLLNHPLLKDVKAADTLQARSLYYFILQTHHYFQGNLSKAEQCATDLIELFEAHAERIKENPGSYITALNNKIGVCLHAKKLDAIPELLAKIRAIPQKYGLKPQSPLAVKTILQTYNVELEMYRDSGDFERGIARIDEISSYLKKPNRFIPSDYRLMLYYQFAYLYFMKKAYKDSLHWLNEIFKSKLGLAREDIQSYARFLNLIIHFELGNITVLKYAVDACRRFLKKKRELRPFESVLLRFFSRISLAHPENYDDLFQQLQHDLFSGSDKTEIENALDYLNFQKWIEGRLSR